MKNAAADSQIKSKDRVLLTIGFIFFCNPVVSLVDILPDAIGALLIIIGLTRASYANARIAKARRMALWLAAFETAKLLVTIPFSSSGISMNSLTAVTVCVVCEGLIFIFFNNYYYSGIDAIALRQGFIKTGEQCPGAKFSAYLFIIIRLLANFVPELIALADMDSKAVGVDFDFEFLDAVISSRSVILFGCAAFAAGVGIYFAVKQYKFIKTFFSEAEVFIAETYNNEYLNNPGKRDSKLISVTFGLASAASLFAFDFSADGIRFMPFFVMFLLLFISTFFISSVKKFRQTRISSVFAAVIFAAAEIYRAVYVIPDPVVIYETKIQAAAVSAAMVTLAAVSGLICVRLWLSESKALAERIGCGAKGYEQCWIFWCLTIVLWAVPIIIPYVTNYIFLVRFAVTFAFIYRVFAIGARLREYKVDE